MQFITCPGTATSVLNGSSDIIRCDVPFESYTLEEVRDMVFENSAAQQSSMTESDFEQMAGFTIIIFLVVIGIKLTLHTINSTKSNVL